MIYDSNGQIKEQKSILKKPELAFYKDGKVQKALCTDWKKYANPPRGNWP